MKVAVWDTYVKRENGKIMHFDILVPDDLTDADKVYTFGDAYLATKAFETGKLNASLCKLCHIEQASPAMVAEIQRKGYSIIEMENCV